MLQRPKFVMIFLGFVAFYVYSEALFTGWGDKPMPNRVIVTAFTMVCCAAFILAAEVRIQGKRIEALEAEQFEPEWMKI